ncbi:efflux RND transporter periplasmic adaptor subunit [Enterococcus sp. AZ101]|uniref:efflux RND transporter periplasmic adaptor subunit n=1 Tax=Enterococcus sp. AZ101 TaxID=2774742 RepID=UPI003D270041
MKKKLLIGAWAIIILGVGVFVYQNTQSKETETAKSISLYEVEKQTPLHLKGQVQAKWTQSVLLSTDKGPVKTIHYNLGDHVTKDAVLVTYEWGEKIKAERDSIIATMNQDAKNDPSKPVMVLKSTENEIKGTVTEYDKEKLSKDMEIKIDYVNQNKSVTGKITTISEINAIDDTSSTNATSNSATIVNYDFTAQPDENIPLGYSVEILIPRNEIHLPTKSIQEKDGKFFAYLIKDKKAQQKEVTVKEEDGFYTLESGLDEGNKIIKNVKGIKDGMEVAVQ